MTVLGGELFVSDRVNHRIQVFAPDADGRMRFKRKFGGQGLAPGRFHEPRGLAAVRGKLVVAEDKRVQCLSPSGAPLQVVPVPGRHTRLRGVGAASGVGACGQKEHDRQAQRGQWPFLTLSLHHEEQASRVMS